MTAVDTNILVYAHRTGVPGHVASRNCLQRLSESSTSWAIPWPCVHEFLGVVTSRRGFVHPSTMPEAIAQIEIWRESRSLKFIGETSDHWDCLQDILIAGNVVGPMTHDARIAAICQQHGVTRFLTADRDFSRFPGLHTVNPLVS